MLGAIAGDVIQHRRGQRHDRSDCRECGGEPVGRPGAHPGRDVSRLNGKLADAVRTFRRAGFRSSVGRLCYP